MKSFAPFKIRLKTPLQKRIQIILPASNKKQAGLKSHNFLFVFVIQIIFSGDSGFVIQIIFSKYLDL